jgi:hypothetical protein
VLEVKKPVGLDTAAFTPTATVAIVKQVIIGDILISLLYFFFADLIFIW